MYTGAQFFDMTGAVAPSRRGALGNASLGGRLRQGAMRKVSLSARMHQGATRKAPLCARMHQGAIRKAPLCAPYVPQSPPIAVAGLNVRRTPWI